ncbi:LuxR C-terminal-related transcriptional regulator [Patiriisocius marinus]|uniref:HTH luxR-type domain-containing protein n=1 Tax=Patiriisocius marinus TaxID=1397112 RepID=A0A5J4IPU8_9FLAO|nr:LuxR C-terminal-related transcriptional regulator [Patiriisocius marinus]GER59759.1 hypothetical protein ULMA_18670 [Patiriisocius marinus]
MTSYLKIKKLLNRSSKEDRQLTLAETLDVLNHLEKIAEDKLLIRKLVSKILYIKNSTSEHASLTKRELQVLKLIGCNFKSTEISTTLSISSNTVSTHRKNIIKKLGIKGTRQLKVIASEHVKGEL